MIKLSFRRFWISCPFRGGGEKLVVFKTNLMVKQLLRGVPFLIILLLALKTEKTIAQSTDDDLNAIRITDATFKKFFKKVKGVTAGVDTVSDIEFAKNLPISYTSQIIEGRASSVSLFRESGEPGVSPSILIRGNSVPYGKASSVFENQPLYVVNGIPLIRNNNPYLSSVKSSTAAIGSGIDVVDLQNLNNIQEIAVIKGAEAVGIYGPVAANGAIIITTKKPEVGSYKINLSSYAGLAIGKSAIYKNDYFPVNGAFVKQRYLNLYNRYATQEQWASFPSYLADSTSDVYFGPANWMDLYFSDALQHGVALDITGGNERANFRFGVSERTENGVVDRTGLERYSVFYDMTMIPLQRLTFNIYAQGSVAKRARNHMLRERFSEQEFITDLEYPLPPNKKYLNEYERLIDNQIDKNGANSLQVKADVQYALSKAFSLNTRFSVDYNDHFRDVFFPASINDGNSYSSYFTGINRRILLDNFAIFAKKVSPKHEVNVRIGQSLMADAVKYDYIQGYRGPSDFIKIIKVDEAEGLWETHNKEFVYSFKDGLNQNLLSFYGNGFYTFKDKYSASLSLRNDGSSFFGNGYNWAVSSVGTLNWELSKEKWLNTNKNLNYFSLKVSGGKSSVLPSTDYYTNGPYYTVDIGWNGSNRISSYNSMPALGLPFSDTYVGGGIKMPANYSWEIGLDAQVYNSLSLSLGFYSRTSKNLFVEIPVDRSYGFSTRLMNGMNVRNSGVEFALAYQRQFSSSVSWSSAFNLTYNNNKLLALPNGLKQVEYGKNHLEVGKPIDQFWVYESNGIFESDSEVPSSPSGQKLSYNGLPFRGGDPVWKDVNNDYLINEEDRVMKGHKLPPFVGAFANNFRYKNFALDFVFVYHLGNSLLNGSVANRLNLFPNGDDLNNVKEAFYWLGNEDIEDYPRFNPWSLVDPYQIDQSLFLEKAGFIKLKSVSLKYSLTELAFVKKAEVSKLEVFVSAMNLFRFSPYTGLYPELTGMNGYDYGYRLPLPVTLSFGVNATFK